MFTSHYCEVLWHSPSGNFTASATATVLYSEFENYIFKITAISPRVQWVNHNCSYVKRGSDTVWHSAIFYLTILPNIHTKHPINSSKVSSKNWNLVLCFTFVVSIHCAIFCNIRIFYNGTPYPVWYWKWLETFPVAFHPSRQESRIISIKPISRTGHQCVCRGSLAWYWRDPALRLDSFHDHGLYYGMKVSCRYGTVYTW